MLPPFLESGRGTFPVSEFFKKRCDSGHRPPDEIRGSGTTRLTGEFTMIHVDHRIDGDDLSVADCVRLEIVSRASAESDAGYVISDADRAYRA